MKARDTLIQGALAVIGLGAAYATWQREPEKPGQPDATNLSHQKPANFAARAVALCPADNDSGPGCLAGRLAACTPGCMACREDTFLLKS